MEPKITKSVIVRIGDGPEQQLPWDDKLRLFTDGRTSVIKVKDAEGKEALQLVTPEGSRYTASCAGTPDRCIYPATGGGKRIEIRFASSANAALENRREPVAPTTPATPATPSAGPAAPVAPPPPSSPDLPLTSDWDRRTKLAAWEKAEKNIPADRAHKVAEDVYQKYGKRPISEKQLRAYYDGAVEIERRKLAAAGPKPRLDLGAPKDIKLGEPLGKRPAAPPKPVPADKPMTMKAFEAQLKDAVQEAFSDKTGYGKKFRGAVEQKIRQALRKTRSPQEKLDLLPDLLKKVQAAVHRRYGIGDKIESRPMGLKLPVTRGKGDVLTQLLNETFPDKAEREKAKAAILADLKTRFGSRHYSPKDVGEAVMRYRMTATDDAVNARPPVPTPKTKKQLAAEALAAEREKKLAEAATQALERIRVIGTMTADEQRTITAKELSELYRAIKDYHRGETSYDAARQQVVTLAQIKAQGLVDGLKSKRATIEMTAKEGRDSSRKLWRAMGEFKELYKLATSDLKTLGTIDPQTSRLKEIAELNTAVRRVRIADIQGEEAKLRAALAKIRSALERITVQMPKSSDDTLKMADLYKTGGALAIAAENLAAFKKAHKGQLPQEVAMVEAQYTALATRLKALQKPLIEAIAKYAHTMPQVKEFSSPSDYQWLTDESPSPDGKLRDLQARYAKTMIDAAHKLLGPDPKKWDDAIIVDPDSRNVERWKSYWQNAQDVMRLVAEYTTSRKTPELLPTTPRPIAKPDPEKIAADKAAGEKAAKAKEAHDKFEPVRTQTQRHVDAVTTIGTQLLDRLGRPIRPLPSAGKLAEFERDLRAAELALSTFEIDESGMSADDIKVADDLRSNALTALALVGKLLRYINRVKASPAPAPAVRPAPTPEASKTTPSAAKLAAHMSVQELLDDLETHRKTLLSATTLGEVEQARFLILKIRETAESRRTEPGMITVMVRARIQLRNADDKIRELGGTPPEGTESRPIEKPTPRPTPPTAQPEPVAPPTVKPSAAREAEKSAVQEAKQALATAEATFTKFNRNLKSQSFADLAKLYQATLDVSVIFSPAAEELKGKGTEYVAIAAKSRAFNKKVGDLSKLVSAELNARLNKRTENLGAIKARGEDAVRAVDAPALMAVKNDMSTAVAAARKELDALSSTDWPADDITGRRAAIDKLDHDVRNLTIEKDAQETKEVAAAQHQLDELRREVDDIASKLAGNPSASQLDDLEVRITKSIASLIPLTSKAAVDAPAKRILARFEAAQRRIHQLREAQATSAEIDKVQKNVTALLTEAETLKDPTRTFEVLKTHQARLVEIKGALEGILKSGLPKTGDTASLERQLNNGIIAVNTYIAELENAIFRKKPMSSTPARPLDVDKVEPKKTADPVESLQEKVTAFRAEAGKLRGSKDLGQQTKNLARLTEIKAALEAIRDVELPKLKGDATTLQYLSESVGYAIVDVERFIKDVTADMEQNSPKGRMEQLRSRIMSERLQSKLTTSDDGNELIFKSADTNDLQTHAEAIGNHVDSIYGRLPKAMLIVVKDPDVTGAADAIKKAFSSRINGLYCVIVKNPLKTDSNADVTLFFDGKPLDARVKALQREIKDGVAGQKTSEAAAEAARVKPLKDLNAIARSRNGSAIESDKDKPLLGKHHVYAMRIRVKTAADAVAFIRQVARALGKSEADDFLVFAHPDIAAGLVDGPSALQVRTQAGGKPGSRVFELSPCKPGEIYIVIPAKGKGIGMARTFNDHFDALWPSLKELGFSGTPQISDPKVAAPKSKMTAPAAPMGKPVHEGTDGHTSATPPAPATSDKPKNIFSLKMMDAAGVEFYLGIKGGKRVVYKGDLKVSALKSKDDKPTPAAIRLENVVTEAKRLGHKRVLVLYRGKRFDDYKPIAEAVAASTGVEIEVRYSKKGSIADTGTAQLVYVMLNDSDNPDTILRAYEDNLSQEH